jgi:hypothetical protein
MKWYRQERGWISIGFAVSLVCVVIGAIANSRDGDAEEPWPAILIFGMVGLVGFGILIFKAVAQWLAKKGILQEWIWTLILFAVSLVCVVIALVAVSRDWNIVGLWWPLTLLFGVLGLIVFGVPIVRATVEEVKDKRKKLRVAQGELPFALSTRTKAYLLLSGVLLLFGGLGVYGLQGGFSGPPPRHTRLRWAGDVDAKANWAQTGVKVEADEELRINASGMVTWASDVAPPNAMVNANGAPWSPRDLTPVADTPENRFPAPGTHCGSLVMKIGNKVQEVGTGASFYISEPGQIGFMVNSRFGWLYQNSGSFHIELEVVPYRTEAPQKLYGPLWISGAGALLILIAIVLLSTGRTDQKAQDKVNRMTAVEQWRPDSQRANQEEAQSPEETVMTSEDLQLPEDWNEREITFAIKKYRGSNLLTKYIGHLFSRLIIGQETRTANRRIEFLRQFNEYAGVARESYKWQRVMAGGRAKQEEDALDLEVKLKIKTQEAALARAQGDLDQIGLDNEAKRLTKQLEIDRLQKQIAELQKPDYKPPERSQAEIKKENREKTERAIKDCEQKQKINKANTELSEESRRRIDNMLSKKLDALHEELEEYL